MVIHDNPLELKVPYVFSIFFKPIWFVFVWWVCRMKANYYWSGLESREAYPLQNLLDKWDVLQFLSLWKKCSMRCSFAVYRIWLVYFQMFPKSIFPVANDTVYQQSNLIVMSWTEAWGCCLCSTARSPIPLWWPGPNLGRQTLAANSEQILADATVASGFSGTHYLNKAGRTDASELKFKWFRNMIRTYCDILWQKSSGFSQSISKQKPS